MRAFRAPQSVCQSDLHQKQRAPQRSSVPRRPALGLSVAQPNPSEANSLVPRLRVSLRKGVNQIVHDSVGIARGRWPEMKPEFEELQNSNGFVLSMIDSGGAS